MARSSPPALPGLPVLGNALSFMRDPVALIRAGRAELGPVFALKMGPKRSVVVVGPEQSRQTIALPESTLQVTPVYQWVEPMFGRVMQAADHEDYLRQRAALVPAFHGHNHGDYLAAIVGETRSWLDSLGRQGTFDAAADLERLSMDIAVRLFLGAGFRDRHGVRFREYFLDIAAGMEFFLPANLPLPRLRRRDRAKKAIFELMRPYLRAVRTDPDTGRHGFLAHLAGSDESFDDDTVIGLILILVYAAYETTAAQLAWALILLLQNPKATAEIEIELADLLVDSRAWAVVDLHRQRLLFEALLEAQRLRPVTTMLTRHTAAAYEVCGYEVPAGWQTLFCPPATHRDEDVFPNPDEFDPSRFSPARDSAGTAASSLLNLGGGLHACLGARFADLEMKAVLAMLLRGYDLELTNADPPPAPGLGVARPLSPCGIRYRARQ
ncbi:cytochrome P450 [Micromonospora sp. LOL_024]|uniref:cytochrome P450 n=1 Tax=Micromonospora sp. LOL_024 TaxID=3345412 RepID=UPI003A84DF38